MLGYSKLKHLPEKACQSGPFVAAWCHKLEIAIGAVCMSHNSCQPNHDTGTLMGEFDDDDVSGGQLSVERRCETGRADAMATADKGVINQRSVSNDSQAAIASKLLPARAGSVDDFARIHNPTSFKE